MALYQRKKGGNWHYRFMFDNVMYSESSKCSGPEGKKLAKEMEANHLTNLRQGRVGFRPVVKQIAFKEAAETYLKMKLAAWAKKTMRIHRNSFESHLKPYFGETMLNNISPELIGDYQSKRQVEGAANRTINIELSLVRLVMGKQRWRDISENVTMLEENENAGRELSDEEEEALLAACKSSSSRGLYTAVLVSLHTAVRNEELRLLRWNQVDLEDGTITVGKSKTRGGDGRIVPLSQMALEVLEEWKANFPNALPIHAVFPREKYGLIGEKGKKPNESKVAQYKTFPNTPVTTFATAWRTAKKKADDTLRIERKLTVEQWKVSGENNGIINLRWHDLRHSSVSRIAAAGTTDQTLQAIAGWMSPKMIKKYSHVRAQAMRKAVSVFDNVGPAQ